MTEGVPARPEDLMILTKDEDDVDIQVTTTVDDLGTTENIVDTGTEPEASVEQEVAASAGTAGRSLARRVLEDLGVSQAIVCNALGVSCDGDEAEEMLAQDVMHSLAEPDIQDDERHLLFGRLMRMLGERDRKIEALEAELAASRRKIASEAETGQDRSGPTLSHRSTQTVEASVQRLQFSSAESLQEKDKEEHARQRSESPVCWTSRKPANENDYAASRERQQKLRSVHSVSTRGDTPSPIRKLGERFQAAHPKPSGSPLNMSLSADSSCFDSFTVDASCLIAASPSRPRIGRFYSASDRIETSSSVYDLKDTSQLSSTPSTCRQQSSFGLTASVKDSPQASNPSSILLPSSSGRAFAVPPLCVSEGVPSSRTSHEHARGMKAAWGATSVSQVRTLHPVGVTSFINKPSATVLAASPRIATSSSASPRLVHARSHLCLSPSLSPSGSRAHGLVPSSNGVHVLQSQRHPIVRQRSVSPVARARSVSPVVSAAARNSSLSFQPSAPALQSVLKRSQHSASEASFALAPHGIWRCSQQGSVERPRSFDIPQNSSQGEIKVPSALAERHMNMQQEALQCALMEKCAFVDTQLKAIQSVLKEKCGHVEA